jgi:hypothetical protein
MGIEAWVWRHGIKLFLGILKFTKNQRENGKWEAQASFFNRLLFARHANGSLSFFLLLRKKQTEVIRLQKE